MLKHMAPHSVHTKAYLIVKPKPYNDNNVTNWPKQRLLNDIASKRSSLKGLYFWNENTILWDAYRESI